MKKIVLTLLSFTILALTTAAQDYKNDKTYSICAAGLAGLSIFIDENAGGFLYGTDIKGEYFISEKNAVSLKIGYLRFQDADMEYPEENFNVIPILAGLNRHFTDWFYVSTDIGITHRSKKFGTAFTYGVSLGFIISKKIDISLNTLTAVKSGNRDVTALLRLGYRF